jgi:hypothetical protein
VADYVHSKQLKFGIYTARGSTTCLVRTPPARLPSPCWLWLS